MNTIGFDVIYVINLNEHTNSIVPIIIDIIPIIIFTLPLFVNFTYTIYLRMRLKSISHYEIRHNRMEVVRMRSDRIKELREDRDIKQREIAVYLNVAQNTYCNYENGVRDFPLPLLIKLSRFYQVNLEYLLGLTDYSAPLPPSKRPK